MTSILVLHGPNLNLLGTREPEVYGRETLAAIDALIADHAQRRGVQVRCYQSNYEGALIEALHQAEEQGLLFNPGAFTHYSLALRDAVGGQGVADRRGASVQCPRPGSVSPALGYRAGLLGANRGFWQF